MMYSPNALKPPPKSPSRLSDQTGPGDTPRRGPFDSYCVSCQCTVRRACRLPRAASFAPNGFNSNLSSKPPLA